MEIIQVETPEQLEQLRQLFQEYFDWVQDFVKIDLNFQAHLAELAGLPGYYAPPAGRLLLVTEGGPQGGTPLGCAALRPLETGVCEIKRMYIRPGWQGQGIGRKLGERLLVEARAAGYHLVRLDTADVLLGAQKLYESLGFRPCQPYYAVPANIAARILFYSMTIGPE